MGATFIPSPPTSSIENGVVTLTASSGDDQLIWAMPLVTYRRLMACGAGMLRAHDANGQVVRLPNVVAPTRKRGEA